MPTSFFQYEMLPTTWFYVSTLILLAVFFKFNRFWSVRNLDLIGLILLTPGLLRLAMCDDQSGYTWLFIVGLVILVRLFFDTVMVRRPLLEPNLTPGGLTFSCFFLLCFVVAALTVNRGDQIDTVRTIRLEQILTTRRVDRNLGMDPVSLSFPHDELDNLPPGFLPFHALSERTSLALAPPWKIRREILAKPVEEAPPERVAADPDPENGPDSVSEPALSPLPRPNLLSEEPDNGDPLPSAEEPGAPARDFAPTPLRVLFPVLSLAVLGHLLITLAFIYIGHCHFGNIQTGIACATLYLLHPYTNQMVGRLDHLIPAALILWSVALYRRPFFSGLGIGCAAALVFYPICLVPLWCGFYSRRGWVRFLAGVASSTVIFVVLLLFSPASLGSFSDQLTHLFGKSSLWIFTRPDGFWSGYDELIYRVPIMATFFALCFGMILWPSRKHLATLLSCSAIVMLSVQFWQLHQGGLFMAWYLPLLILTVFRPNLEDRVAQSVVVS